MPRDKVGQIRAPADHSRFASRVAYATHFIVRASAQIQDAMDGGTPMDTDTWHPLRGFKFHEPAKVQELAARLATLPQEMREPGRPLHDDLWTQAEAMKVVELFQRASGAEEAVTHIDLTRTRKITS